MLYFLRLTVWRNVGVGGWGWGGREGLGELREAFRAGASYSTAS